MSGEDSDYGYGKRIGINSTITNLGVNEIYTGTMLRVLEYNYIRLVIISDVDSALNGIELQFNNDTSTINFENIITDTYISPGTHIRDYPIKSRFFRLKYTNGSSAQTSFRIDTYVSTNGNMELSSGLGQVSKNSSLNNYSITLLGIDEIYTGTGEDVSNYKTLELHIESDVASATNGIDVQFSNDNSTWNTNSELGTLTYSSINSQFYKSYKIENKYYRIIYTNSSTAQKKFKLYSLLIPNKKIENEPKNVRLNVNHLDAFARIRISDMTTLAQYKHTQTAGNDIIKNESTSGTADKTYNNNEATITLRVEAANSSIIRQSKRYIPYQPGKSFLILLTGNLDTGKYNLTTPQSGYNESDTISRIGFYDEYNGYYFKYVGNGLGTGDLYVVERSYVNGSVIDNEIKQDYWNVDRLNGYDLSGIKFNATSANIFLLDMQWLGVGSVRMGIMINNKIIYVHKFSHSGNRSTTYIGSSTLPIRYELTSGSTGSNYYGTMKEICATVISEGGYTPIGIPRSISMSEHADITGNHICSIDQTETPIIALRLKHNNRRATAQILGYNGICTTGGNILLRLRYYSNYSDNISNQTPMTKTQAWQSVSDYSYLEFDINDIDTATEMDLSTANSYIISTSYFSNNTDTAINNTQQETYLTCDIENSTPTLTKRDVILLTGQRIGGSGSEKVNCSINWSEFD